MRMLLTTLLAVFVLTAFTDDVNAQVWRRARYGTTYYYPTYNTPYVTRAETEIVEPRVYYESEVYPAPVYYNRSYYTPRTSYYYSPYDTYYPPSAVQIYGPRGGGIRVR
jgi:hypothetical protein